MKITGGKARSIQLQVPSSGTRPATDQLRQAVFSSIGPKVFESTVLDLFAGSGAYGLEALSRGATQITFVEYHKKAIHCLKNNIRAVCKSIQTSEATCKILPIDAWKWSYSEKFDIIFLDPPYPKWNQVKLEIFPKLPQMLTENGLLIAELPGNESLAYPSLEEHKRLGKNKNGPNIAIFKKLTPK